MSSHLPSRLHFRSSHRAYEICIYYRTGVSVMQNTAPRSHYQLIFLLKESHRSIFPTLIFLYHGSSSISLTEYCTRDAWGRDKGQDADLFRMQQHFYDLHIGYVCVTWWTEISYTALCGHHSLQQLHCQVTQVNLMKHVVVAQPAISK
jgi:hypothetical protein